MCIDIWYLFFPFRLHYVCQADGLISLSDKLFLFHYLLFQGYSLALSIETNVPVFSFCSTFSVWNEVEQLVTHCAVVGVSLYVWGCGSISYRVSMCPVPLVRKLDLTWTQIMSFLRMGLQPSPWWEVGLAVGRQRLSWVWARNFPHLSAGHCPLWCGVSSTLLEEPLRYVSKLAPSL